MQAMALSWTTTSCMWDCFKVDKKNCLHLVVSHACSMCLQLD